ncbi:general stress protein [uncultured Corynebacterium sp.]|uniref:general stress protein n=1 Tax=uncultured Corynebacterium sp. TaxID=159447 RepID=UPI0025F52245|nr:general stress protein [uncultured Corynebacterium sp.]
MSQLNPAPGGASASRRPVDGLQRPSGWPVGSFKNYEDAQAAVDGLSDREFPVEDITIVGVDLMQVERVTGRLTWGRVLAGGALSGMWFGLFVGLLFALFTPDVWKSLLSALVIGLLFGIVFAALGYAFTRGRRDFSSATTIVAGRYDILCEPSSAPRARDMIAEMGPRPAQSLIDESPQS